MSDNTITIEVDGTVVKARKGQMLIEATDTAGTHVPRFCYHPKLSVAANCRMCLVEVEKSPKPVPACATPVADGMKVFTRSPKAIAAQRATMEFLLINHPLDCPICDQGGECELQDQAMGFGRGVSRYAEGKRVVRDQDLGPLVSTDMTRCIHCTRCVRFTQEIAGFQELGTMGRGERTEIGTYVARSVDHELSGNIVDLCPVGALNNKPYRYAARAWEMTRHPGISPHDCAGSNLDLHVLRGTVKRIVPRAMEAINETWISDRDRYGFYGLYAEDRLRQPLLRRDGQWQAVDWEQALEYAARELAAHAGDSPGILCNPSATLEEMYLLSRLARRLSTRNLDYRLRQRDTRDQDADPLYPSLGGSLQELGRRGSVLVVGSNLRREVPIVAHRIRSAARVGARVSFVNPARYEYLFPVRESVIASRGLARELRALLRAAAEQTGGAIADAWRSAVLATPVEAGHRAIVADLLASTPPGTILLGLIALRDPAYSEIRALAAALCGLVGATLGQLSEGANSAGAALIGVLPHRELGGQPVAQPGLSAAAMVAAPRPAHLLFGAEPDADFADPQQFETALAKAAFNIAFTAFDTPALRRSCHLLLPLAGFAETSGTYVNVEGRWQGFTGAAAPVGESRPGWKILRVLGNLLELPGCDYNSSADVRTEIETQLGGHPAPDSRYAGTFAAVSAELPVSPDQDIPMYAVDPVVRRAQPLQATRIAGEASRAAQEA